MLSKLSEHAALICKAHLTDLFAEDPNRAKKLTIDLDDIFIDYSKNHLNQKTLALLFEYADKCQLTAARTQLLNGSRLNTTENQPVLHTLLRSTDNKKLGETRVKLMQTIHQELEKLKQFTTAIHAGSRCGYTNKPFDTFVNIGIGGSDLGVKMAVTALAKYRLADTRSFFIANVDYQQIAALKNTINPETTLFIIASKSFNTLETLKNADSIKQWLVPLMGEQITQHFAAVTTNTKAALDYGIAPEYLFNIPAGVPGRLSLWSAMGLSVALAISYDNFSQLLAGANTLDLHFESAPMAQNAPIILGLLDFWYARFFTAATRAVIVYDESLRKLPDYLAQLFMESNGKATDVNGAPVDYQTAPIIWGGVGTAVQHSFFQLLHQGTHTVPIDFLMPLSQGYDQSHHQLLLANCLAQSQTLMQGETDCEQHRRLPGNKPSTTILYNQLTPATLGRLLALFEHRVFVHGVLLQINSFDQWGVESSKTLSDDIYQTLLGSGHSDHDPSTNNLIARYKKLV